MELRPPYRLPVDERSRINRRGGAVMVQSVLPYPHWEPRGYRTVASVRGPCQPASHPEIFMPDTPADKTDTKMPPAPAKPVDPGAQEDAAKDHEGGGYA